MNFVHGCSCCSYRCHPNDFERSFELTKPSTKVTPKPTILLSTFILLLKITKWRFFYQQFQIKKFETFDQQATVRSFDCMSNAHIFTDGISMYLLLLLLLREGFFHVIFKWLSGYYYFFLWIYLILSEPKWRNSGFYKINTFYVVFSQISAQVNH